MHAARVPRFIAASTHRVDITVVVVACTLGVNVVITELLIVCL